MDILTIHGLKKKFGSQEVIKGLDLQVPHHSIIGFIGQNGAGKTTTMKMILGLLPMDEGEIYVCGEKVVFGKTKINHHIGYLSDVPAFYTHLNAVEYLRLCGEISGMSKELYRTRSEELLRLTGLWESRRKHISTYSRGMKQRLGIAQALLHDPALLLADEPTSALDPTGRREILNILAQIKSHTTILFSTHILSDVESICDQFAILHEGKIQRCGSMKQLHEQPTHTLTLEFLTAEDTAEFHSFSHLPIQEVHKNRLVFQSSDMTWLQQSLHQELLASKLPIRCMELQEPTLETLYMEVVK